MHRLALDIDPVAYIRNTFGGKNPDPIHILVLAELGGAESIVCYYRDDLKTVNTRDVNLFREVVKTYLNIRTNLTEKNIRNLLNIKPNACWRFINFNLFSRSAIPRSRRTSKSLRLT